MHAGVPEISIAQTDVRDPCLMKLMLDGLV